MKNILDKIKKLCKPIKDGILKISKVPFVGYLLLACLMNYILEVLSRHSFLKALLFIKESPMVFLYNVFIIFVTLSLVLFAKRRVFATVFVCAMWVVSAFANYIVLCFRTTPFSAIDVLMIRNVMTMLDKYLTKWQMVLSVIGIILVIALLVYLYIRLPKIESKRHPLRASAYVCMCLFLIVTLTKVAVETQTVSDNFGNLAYAYNDYGFAYCFSNSIIDVGIGKPKEYSEERVEEIVDGLDYDKSEVILVTKEEAEEIRREAEEGRIDAGQTDEDTKDTENTAEGKDTETDNLSSDASGDRIVEGGALQEDGSQEETGEKQADVIDNSGDAQPEEEDTEEPKADGIPDWVNGDDAGTGQNETADTQDSGEEGKVSEREPESEISYYRNEKATPEHPNIIVIQLESIFDTRYMKDFHTSEDPMPTLTALKRDYSWGLLTVPAVGAGTANTEFEVQTGMSTQFFGAGEYPFKTIMTSTSCDSMAYDLKRQGYATAGFHNNDATFYERYVDYSNLGFDTFTGMEHMYMLNYTPRGWAKDDVLDDVMIDRMAQTEGRDYITTITVQGHGRYPKKYTATLTDVNCYFTGKYAEDTEKRAAWLYYINMCRETDNMVAALLYKLEKFDEPTVIFMYGDHLPSLNLEQEDLQEINLYQTEWIMWDNIGLTKENKDFTAYQASTYIFNRLNLKGGLMQNFHNRYMAGTPEEEYLSMLEMMEYDVLYGKDYAFDSFNPFPQTQMQMGIREISLERYEIIGDEVFIYGTGFNEFSEVYVDGKSLETEYVNYKTLKVSLEEFEDGKELYVAQAGDDHIVLSVTNSIEITWEDSTQTSEEDGQPDDENTTEGTKEVQ